MSKPIEYSSELPSAHILNNAFNELKIAGFFDKESPNFSVTYPFALEVLDIIERIHKCVNEGVSLFETLEIIVALSTHKNITPLTSNKDEWLDISEYMGGNACWQNKRNPSVFSKDNGHSCFNVDTLKKRSKITGVELPAQHIEWTDEDFKNIQSDEFLQNNHVVHAQILSNDEPSSDTEV